METIVQSGLRNYQPNRPTVPNRALFCVLSSDPQTHDRLRIQERLVGKPSPSQRCILPRSNDRRHIHVYLHTHVSANRDQYVLQHSLVPALALAAQMAGEGMSVWGKEGAGPAIAPRQMFSSFLGDTELRKPIQGCWSRIAGSVPCSSLCPHGHLRFILFHL